MRLKKEQMRNNADSCAYLYRGINEKYGQLLVRIRKRIAYAITISHPDHPFYPSDDDVQKAIVMKTANSLHRIALSEKGNGHLAVTRRELVGWPGLQVPEVANECNGD